MGLDDSVLDVELFKGSLIVRTMSHFPSTGPVAGVDDGHFLVSSVSDVVSLLCYVSEVYISHPMKQLIRFL